MLEKLHAHGFRTLVDTDVAFDPLTIMIGRNGVGKTSVLDTLQLIGNFARGGASRAFGPPPWSLGWQRTKGIGNVQAIRVELQLHAHYSSYKYFLALDERDGEARVIEERVMRLNDHRTLASFEWHNPPTSGTILNPNQDLAERDEVSAVAAIMKSVVSYELNPSMIEQGTDPEHDYISRDGFGVAGFLANLKDAHPDRFEMLEKRVVGFRPETESIDIWAASGKVFWGLRDRGQKRAFPAVHLSWGDRQLVGLLCVLYSTKADATIAIEEIDRGFHYSRYAEVIELLSEAAYDGLDGRSKMQIVITTHSPSFVNRLGDRISEIRMVTRAPGGGTQVRPLQDVLNQRLGTTEIETPIGEAWESGLLEDLINEAM